MVRIFTFIMVISMAMLSGCTMATGDITGYGEFNLNEEQSRYNLTDYINDSGANARELMLDTICVQKYTIGSRRISMDGVIGLGFKDGKLQILVFVTDGQFNHTKEDIATLAEDWRNALLIDHADCYKWHDEYSRYKGDLLLRDKDREIALLDWDGQYLELVYATRRYTGTLVKLGMKEMMGF